MAKEITTKKFASNVAISLAAQIVSMAVSFVVVFIVTKYIDETQYSYWQFFALFASNVGVLHLGLLDGIVLRYSKYDYDELDKARVNSQFKFMLSFTSAVAVITALVSAVAAQGAYREIFFFVAAAVVLKNYAMYGSYLCQITNRITKYAITLIVQRMLYFAVVVVLLALKVNDYRFYCAGELFGDLVCAVMGMIFSRGLYFARSIPMREAWGELKTNISAGIILMIANWSAILVTSGAKLIVQWRWGELTFGKVSFAFTASSAFLSFVTAASVVTFPSLKRLDPEKLPALYVPARNVLSVILYSAMAFYFVGNKILSLWLPVYSDSLTYLALLLPIIIYMSRVSLLTNNFLKVYRKEKLMMAVNLSTIALAALLFVVGAYGLGNLTFVLVSVVAVQAVNALLGEICVLHVIGKRLIRPFIVETLMTAAFILCASLLPLWWGFGAYLGLLVLFLAFNHKTVRFMAGSLLGKFRKKAVSDGENIGENNIPVSPFEGTEKPQNAVTGCEISEKCEEKNSENNIIKNSGKIPGNSCENSVNNTGNTDDKREGGEDNGHN